MDKQTRMLITGLRTGRPPPASRLGQRMMTDAAHKKDGGS